MTARADLSQNRLVLGLFGGVTGGALWLLIDRFAPDEEGARLVLFLGSVLAGFGAASLALAGPMPLARAMTRALVIALGAGVLLSLEGLQFDAPEDTLRAIHPLAAWAVLIFLCLPFAIALDADRGKLRDYSLLFRAAWSVVVRLATAWLFVAVFWLVYFLSNALLRLVGFDLLERLAGEGWFLFTVSGLVLGMAMAVLNDLSVALSPGLVLRLLRLLLPAVTLVAAVFLVLLPVRGFGSVFGGLSAGATLLAIAAGAITLIASALDEDDDCAVRSPLMRVATQALALLLPVIAALACWAIWLRISEHGLTPPRVVAATAAVVVSLYALLYAGSVLLRGAWMARIRRVNIWMALGLIGLSALWLTPTFDAERWSAESQVARYEDGRVAPAELDLWALRHDWGCAGTAALARMRGMTDHPGHAELDERLVRLERAPDRMAFEMAVPEGEEAERAVLLDRIGQRLRVIPEGAAEPRAALAAADTGVLRDIDRGCGQTLDDGSPACVLLAADRLEGWRGPRLAIFHASGGGGTAALFIGPDGSRRSAIDVTRKLHGLPPERVISALLSGEAVATAPSQPALVVEGVELLPIP